MRTPLLLLAALLILPLGGCRQKPILDDPSRYTVIVGDQDYFSEPVSFRDDIGLHARAVRNTLVLSWRNNRAEEIMVRPEDLFLVTGPNRETDVFPFNTMNVNLARFTPLLLKSGQAGVQVVEMRVPFQLAGQRVAYNNRRQELMVRTDVE
jgi:hypothetical protein